MDAWICRVAPGEKPKAIAKNTALVCRKKLAIDGAGES
jgi:hypothetical protein